MSEIKDWKYHPSKRSRFVLREQYDRLMKQHQRVIADNVELNTRIDKARQLLMEYPVIPVALHNALMDALTESDKP